MLVDFVLILVCGFFGGIIIDKFKIPALVGMILIGIMLGSQGMDILSPSTLKSADNFRTLAVMIILMKAGLGLDRQKLQKQGQVALKLGFLPAICEMVIITFLSIYLLNFDILTGLLLGCILAAESPAVIVPGMLRLKSLGWGVKKGIPDAILTGSALSDVLLLLIFSLLITFLSGENALNFEALPWLFLQLISQIIVGIFFGWLLAKILIWILVKQKVSQGGVYDTLITASLSLLLVLFSHEYPFFSGYLAVMSCGFFLIEFASPLARRLRQGFDVLWRVAQIFLFVLLGANIQLNVLGNTLGIGLLIILVGTLVGRMLGWYLSTWGSNWSGKEKLFLLPANSAKATVQAAVGAIPLSLGIDGGEEILAIASLSILVTAPLGAWAIPTFAPRLLQRGEVDATKVIIEGNITILSAIDDSTQTQAVLTKTAAMARRSDAQVIVLHVIPDDKSSDVNALKLVTRKVLADIDHQFLVREGSTAQQILTIAQDYGVSEIVMGKRNVDNIFVGSISRYVLENSLIPVMIIDN
ncbi:cation:proton antiporter [Cyanobacterium stanieri LEGE 03274]|uniref:Cation:proton antiporter n=1 Tax=Cyanobacterium stanieri LEGE 03274 TaxID=1828756 RepID=A0ABR9V7N6_9CHRO|nr:cation:proton antiporter [Cyanobacterium stanieri]MBE9222829.1 cation:proton antiporter [Cyanobacterium stanieri LEGE 03274]